MKLKAYPTRCLTGAAFLNSVSRVCSSLESIDSHWARAPISGLLDKGMVWIRVSGMAAYV